MSAQKRAIVVVEGGRKWEIVEMEDWPQGGGYDITDVAAEIAERLGARTQDVCLRRWRPQGEREFVLSIELVCPVVQA